jgi:ABC-2 type transport system permease protein
VGAGGNPLGRVDRPARGGGMMFRRILLHDWRTLRADVTIAVTALVFGAALAYGLYNGLRFTTAQRQAIQAAADEERTRFEDLRAETERLEREAGSISAFRDQRNPSVLGQTRGGRYAVLPSLPLAPLSIGQSDLLPPYYRMSTDAREAVLSSAELENPRTLLTGRFDLSFVIIYLYPLLILVLSYNLLSAEKEQGTLPLVLSQPVSLGSLVRAKILLRGVLIVGFAVAVCLAGLAIGRLPLTTADAAFRLALWCLVLAAYGAVWFSLAVLVSSFGQPSSTNAMALAGCWLAIVVLAPTVINLGVTTAYPVPSRVRMIQAIRIASDTATTQGSKLLARYYEDHPELVTTAEKASTDFNALRVAVNADVERQVRPVVEHYEQQLAAQQRTVGVLRYLSPAIVTQDALSDLAGTGSARHQHFVSLVDRFHREWREFFTPRILQKARVTNHSEIPAFVYVEEPFAHVLVRTSVNLLALAAPALCLAAAGLRRLPRFRIAG